MLHAVDWADRSEFWQSLNSANPPRPKRERSSLNLILCGHGASLRVDAGTLLVKNGFTHYPQQQEIFRYFRGGLDRPARIILLDGSGSISFDVLDWLSEQEIPLIRINWKGDVTCVIGGSGYSADRAKIEWQKSTRADPKARLAFSCGLISQKIKNSILALEQLPTTKARDTALSKLRGYLDKLSTSPPTNVDKLRGLEGGAALNYFRAWHGIELDWAGTSRRPIPEAWRTIGPRTAQRVWKTERNERASHPVNAMLNYGYAVLQSQMQIQAVSEGYNPTLGIMHHGYQNSPAFLFDLMEPSRPVVDRDVLKLALSNKLDASDFIIRADGACRLNPEMARYSVQRIATALNVNSPSGGARRRIVQSWDQPYNQHF